MYLPQVYDFLEIDSEIYTVMDFIPGKSLAQELEQNHSFPQKQVLKWAVQLAEALKYLHEQNPPIIHSDIKPANIMLTPKGDICLIDFNISLAFDKEMRNSSGISKGYSPPEQYHDMSMYYSFKQTLIQERNKDSATAVTATLEDESKNKGIQDETKLMEFPSAVGIETESLVTGIVGAGIDERSDIYSLGATLYHLLTGIKPIVDFEAMIPISQTGVKISEGFAHIIEKMMETLPQKRYQNGGELLYALQHIYILDSAYQKFYRKHRIIVCLIGMMYVISTALVSGGIVMAYKEKNATYNEMVEQASAWIVSGEYDRALNGLERAKELIPSRLEASAKQILLYFERGDYENSIQNGKNILNNVGLASSKQTSEASLGEITYVMGNAYYEIEDYQNAVLCFESSLTYNEKNSSVYRDYAVALAKTGNLEKADEILKKAETLGLGQDSVYMVQGEIAFSRGQYEAAVELLRKAFQTTDTEYLKKRSVLLCVEAYKMLGDDFIDQEILTLEQVQSSMGAKAGLHIMECLGNAYARKAELHMEEKEIYYKKAIGQFETILLRGYSTFQVMENLVILYQQTDQFSLAVHMLEKMQINFPERYEVYKRWAFLEADMQQEKAIEGRDYHAMYEAYQKAKEQYQQMEVEDTEMQMLEGLVVELQDGGWLY